MNYWNMSITEILQAIEASPGNSLLVRCADILVSSGQDTFAVSASPADVLRRTLEVKFKVAADRGRTFEGRDELFLALSDLGAEPIVGVSARRGLEFASVYFTAATLEVVDPVIMHAPQE